MLIASTYDFMVSNKHKDMTNKTIDTFLKFFTN